VCVDLALRSVCLFLDEGVSLSVCVPLVCLSLFVSHMCVSQCFFLSLSVRVSLSLCVSLIVSVSGS